jgi:hypothetical protein
VTVSDSRLTHADLDAHYCDLCADERNTHTTRHLAWLGAATLLVLASTTAAALALGSREWALQLAICFLVGGVAPLALRRAGVWSSLKGVARIQKELARVAGIEIKRGKRDADD